MKKIFTSFLFAAFAIIGLNAQSFEFRMNGEKVADGATVTGFICNKHIVKQQWMHKTEGILSLYNLTDKDIKYTVFEMRYLIYILLLLKHGGNI